MLRIIGTEYNPVHQAFEVYVAGCTRNCPGCHNPESHSFGRGRRWPEWLRDNRFKLGTQTFKHVWVLGGDLLCQPDPVDALEFIKTLHRALPGFMKLWLWTGGELKDVPPDLFAWLHYVKTGEYRQSEVSVLIRYDDGDTPLLLASGNQQLWKIKEKNYEPCHCCGQASADS